MPTHSVFKAGKTALITGAASGIGLEVAKLCRKHGMKLALVDKNSDALSDAKSILDKDDTRTETYAMDVSQPNEWKDLRSNVESTFGRVDFLMLNAAIALKGEWDDMMYFQKIFSTNLGGVTMGLSTFLPLLRSSSEPNSIVITGSKQGITNPPGNPAYNASKAAVKSLAESLSYELRSTQTSVHLLVPGWTFTGLTRGGGLEEKPDGAWWPEQVADHLEKKMAENKFYIICPDNDVTAEKDKKRMLWTVGDVINERPPLSRWREEFKEEAEDWMMKQNL